LQQESLAAKFFKLASHTSHKFMSIENRASDCFLPLAACDKSSMKYYTWIFIL